MRNTKVICALIGLMGAVNNNGKTDTTDAVVREALLGQESAEMIEKVHGEKFKVSPSCASCQNPCGNTSDYDPDKFANDSPKIKAVKDEVALATENLVRQSGEELPQLVYKAIAYLGYEMKEESYRKLLEEFK